VGGGKDLESGLGLRGGKTLSICGQLGACPLIGLVKIFATLMKTVDRRQPTTLETEMTPTKDEGPKQ